jgi:signal peptidase II
VLVTTVGCDQVTKLGAIRWLAEPMPRPTYTYLGDMVRIQYAENTGAFLGLGSWFSEEVRFWIFTVFTAALLVALAIYLWRGKNLLRSDILALSLLLAGGVGNLIDRVFRDGVVVDFMNLGIGRLRTGVFNVADVAVMAGVFLLIGMHLFLRKDTGDSSNEHETA